MKHYKFLFFSLIISLQVSAQKDTEPWSEKIILNSAIKNRVILDAHILDKYGKDKIITGFLLRDTKADTVLIDQIHNEGAKFLFHPLQNGLLTIVNDFDENEKLLSTFQQFQIILVNQKLKVKEKFIPSGSIVNYLKRFKNIKK